MGDENSEEDNDEKKSLLFETKSTNSRDSEGNLIDENGNKVEWDNSNIWVNFSISILNSFILSLLIGVFGSCFIYLTTRGSELDDLLPSDSNHQFYMAKLSTKKKGPYTDINCVEHSFGESSSKIEANFPYNLIDSRFNEENLSKTKAEAAKKGGEKIPYGTHMQDWFGRMSLGCFTKNRDLLKTWFSVFDPDSPLGNHAFQICIAFPFTMSISMISIITGFIFAVGSAFGTHSKLPIGGIFLGYLWILAIGFAILIFARLIITICLLPLMENWKEVGNIIACNIKTIAVVFGYFVCSAAYENLHSTTSGIMGIVYLLLVGYTVYKFFGSKKEV
jgi:hypothetical protein